MWYKVNKRYIWTQQVRPSSRLPSAYQEVEYIENNGTAYFKLGINIRDGYKFIGKIRSLQNENMDGGALTGGYIWNSGNIYYRLYVWAIRNGRRSYGYLEHFTNGGTGNGSLNTDYTVEYSWISGNAYFKVNNTTYFTYTSTYSTDKVGEVPLLGWYGDGYGYYANPGIRLYYAQYYDKNGNLVRDLVPCYRKSDWVIWMYDLVNNQFYINSWSWTFTKWPDVN